jgi:hypothetical protein
MLTVLAMNVVCLALLSMKMKRVCSEEKVKVERLELVLVVLQLEEQSRDWPVECHVRYSDPVEPELGHSVRL